jgi:hypothetical protein
MYHKSNRNEWIKYCIAVLLALNLLFLIGEPTNVSSGSLSKLSDQVLYIRAFGYARDKDYVNAVMYLFAYKMREPSVYMKDVNHHKTDVDNAINDFVGKIKSSISKSDTVELHINKCQCYPCDRCQIKPGSQVRGPASNPPAERVLLQPPPDAAIVCEHINYDGKCYILSVRAYNNAEQIGLPNDTISSVMVGSNVKLTLFVHGGLTGESITFFSNDPDLTDNWIDSQYVWNDNTTSLNVELR